MWIRTSLCALLVLSLQVPRAVSQQASRIEAPSPPKFDIGFPRSTTLDDFAREVRRKTGANIVVDSGVGRLWLPNVWLKGVTLAAALSWVPTTRGAREQGVRLEFTRVTQDSNTVYVFTSFGERRPGPAGRVRAFVLADESWEPLSAEAQTKAIADAVRRRNQVS
jgi:hypothetical protein